MKVTKAQAQENRARIVAIASKLFREHGYDGVGVADLMSAAGFTHGGFYKHFGSKADLMAETAAYGLSQSATQANSVDIVEFVKQYTSRAHRDQRSDGCTMAALSGDAARQSDAVKATFAHGIESLLTTIECKNLSSDQQQARAQKLNMLAHLVGAIMLSRACPDDSQLADEILEVCGNDILSQLMPHF